MKTLVIFFLGITNALLLGGCAESKKDNRVVLHSESQDTFSIKDSIFGSFGSLDHIHISKSKLAVAIANRLSSVSKVYDVSDQLDEGWINDDWSILFSVRTTSDKVYTGFKCDAYADGYRENDKRLHLRDCRTDDDKGGAKFHDINIPLDEIISVNIEAF